MELTDGYYLIIDCTSHERNWFLDWFNFETISDLSLDEYGSFSLGGFEDVKLESLFICEHFRLNFSTIWWI